MQSLNRLGVPLALLKLDPTNHFMAAEGSPISKTDLSSLSWLAAGQ